MKCPKCKLPIGYVNIYKSCREQGRLEGRTVVAKIQATLIGATLRIECPFCGVDLTNKVTEKYER